jgi:hypothetical protein
MRRMIVIGALLLGACGDNKQAPRDAGIEDAPADADPAALVPCLDRPGDLARPPVDQLPCELLPPDFTLTRGAR